MRTAALVVGLFAVAMFATACKSTHEEGVKSDMMSQWVTVNANTMVATDAAKAELMSQGLKDVTAESTNVDGKAMGKKADGTKVEVEVKKVDAKTSKVEVEVGTMGDPKLGAEIAKNIKARIDTMNMKTGT